MYRQGLIFVLFLLVSACTSQAPREGGAPALTARNNPDSLRIARPDPRIVSVSAPLQCVPYARDASGIAIRGDAWTWWQEAEGRYQRSSRPSVGSVLVLMRTQRLRYGHLAVVTAILNDREIVVRHANWLNRGQVHEDTPVVDVSPANDWSLVRFWYTPGKQYGKQRYPANGFIHGEAMQAAL